MSSRNFSTRQINLNSEDDQRILRSWPHRRPEEDWIVAIWFGGSWRHIVCTYHIAQTFEQVYILGKREIQGQIRALIGIPT